MKQSSIEFLLDKFGDVIGDINTTNEQDLMLMEIIKQAKAMHEDEMKKFGIKCQMAMYSSDHVWSVEDVWDKEFKKQQNETK